MKGTLTYITPPIPKACAFRIGGSTLDDGALYFLKNFFRNTKNTIET